ncbi:MAG: NAD(+)/NADH kinase [Coriobacteriales bacterium]|nr:NAD(+)/NADH kinase [Coriobacteriales bacterium]
MNILLIANKNNAHAYDALHIAEAWLGARGINTENALSDKLTITSPELASLHARAGEFDLICAFGGDGTILRGAHVAFGADVPLLGFNFGNLGFLTGAPSAGVVKTLEAALAGEVASERRTMLKATLTFDDDSTVSYYGLNEVTLASNDFGRAMKAHVNINGEHLYDLRGDGMIISTPTGSTAYALSAGGPLVAPGLRGLVVVPISSHSLASRSVVCAATDVVEIVPTEASGPQIVCHVDGQEAFATGYCDLESHTDAEHSVDGGVQDVCALSKLEVASAADDLLLIRADAPDFYSRLSSEFFDGDK